MTKPDNDDTAAFASIGDVAACTARVDALVLAVLTGLMAQKRSTQAAFDYVKALLRGAKANCWALAEAAGHEGWHRMQAVVGSHLWDWRALRAQLASLAADCVPDDPNDLVGPGLALDETAQPKRGDATAGVSPQHAGCAGRVINCVTTVFAAYVTALGHAWVDFEHYLPQRWADDPGRRRKAHIPDDQDFAAKTDLAIRMVHRLATASTRIGWVAFDEVYGSAEKLRVAVARLGLAYVGIIPCTHPVPLPSGTAIPARDALDLAVFERRSAGNGSRGPRDSDWALIATAVTGQYLLIRRLLGRDANNLTYYLCWAPPGTAATMRYFVTIAGRRWPIEETFKLCKDVLGWDLTQVRTLTALARHTALTALAQLRATALRAALDGHLTPPTPTSTHAALAEPAAPELPVFDPADLRIPLGDAPVPTRGGLPCPPGLPPIRLSVAETLRVTDLVERHHAGLISLNALAFGLRWSLRRRRHQATARWHHYSRHLTAITASG